MEAKAPESMEEKIREAVEAALEDRLDDLTDEIADQLEDRMREIVDEAVSDSIGEAFAEGIEDFLSGHQLLKDGAVLQTRPRTRVMSPDQKKVLVCYGGLRVDGKSLFIQTRLACWEDLCRYATEEEAAEALRKVNAAIAQGLPLIEL